MSVAEIKREVNAYNGRKRLTDREIREIAWFVRVKGLTVKEAVAAYFEDKDEEKHLSHGGWLEEYEKYVKDILEHCAGCRWNDVCVKNLMLDARTRYDLKDVKSIFRSECWKS